MPMTREAMQAAVDDPATGSIKRRALRRLLTGVRAVGPTSLSAPSPEPVRRRDAAIEAEHAVTVADEVAAIDAHLATIEKKSAAGARGSVARGTGRDSYEDQELRSEARQLRELRAEIEREAGRPTRTASGHLLDDRTRALLRSRVRVLRDGCWFAAEREAGQGEHRHARRNRVDALRARHIVEYEMGLRPFLAGYSQPWN